MLPLVAVVFLLVAVQAQESNTPSNTDMYPAVITSPQVCIRNSECSPSQMCTSRGHERIGSYICRNRDSLGQECGPEECLEELFCPLVDSPVCVGKIPLGESCSEGRSDACAGNMTICNRSGLCEVLKTGFAGDPCTKDEECQQEQGFYCKAQTTCARKKMALATCINDLECEGFCLTNAPEGRDIIAPPSDVEGICAPAQLEGGMCRINRHCKQVFRRSVTTDQLVCNKHRVNLGVCVRESRLIRVLGATCQPSFDRCDAERGLRCLWASSSQQYVCQQKITEGRINKFCTPGSPLSACSPVGGRPHVCRRAGNIRRQPEGLERDFLSCAQTDSIPDGRWCTKSVYSACEENSKCSFVPGIQVSAFPTWFCVRTVGMNASCADKFSTKCDENLSCVAGRCVPSSPTLPNDLSISSGLTHADFGVDCSKLPCIPGAVCTMPDGELVTSNYPVCKVPSRVLKEGGLCFDTVLVMRTCAAGLVCRQNNEGLGLLRCRKPGLLGQGGCGCAEGLECSSIMLNNPLRTEYTARCSYPSLSLPIGAKCDPFAGVNATERCKYMSVPVGSTGYNNIVSLKCLPKGTGFACQRVASLYHPCSVEQNIGCADRAVCSELGLCLPPS